MDWQHTQSQNYYYYYMGWPQYCGKNMRTSEDFQVPFPATFHYMTIRVFYISSIK